MEQTTSRKFSNLYCPHCRKEVSKSTWYVHYNDFYDKSTRSWELSPEVKTSERATDLSSSQVDFDFHTMEFEEFGDAMGCADSSYEMIQNDHFDNILDYESDSDSESSHNNLASAVSQSSVYSRIAILGELANFEGKILCLRYNLLHISAF